MHCRIFHRKYILMSETDLFVFNPDRPARKRFREMRINIGILYVDYDWLSLDEIDKIFTRIVAERRFSFCVTSYT